MTARTLATAALLLSTLPRDASATPEAPAATAAAPSAAGKAEPGRVVARVNGVAIPGATLDREVQRALSAPSAPSAPGTTAAPDPAKVRSGVLEQLVSMELIHQAAVASKVKASEAQLQAEVDKLRGRFSDPAKFQEFLKEQGTTEAQMRTDLQRMLTIRAWLEREIEGKLQPAPEAEVRQYYESHPNSFKKPEAVHMRHILFRARRDAPATERAAQRKKADAALARIKGGEDFAQVAREVSEDKSTAAQGGDLGEYVRGVIGGNFEKAAFELAKGQISGVVETEIGFHVIQVLERHPAGRLIPFEQIKDELGTAMLEQARQKKLEATVQELRKAARIELL